MERIIVLSIRLVPIACFLSTPAIADPVLDRSMLAQGHDLHLMIPHSVEQELALHRFITSGRVSSRGGAADAKLDSRLDSSKKLFDNLRNSSKAVRIADRLLGGNEGFRLKVDPGDKGLHIIWRATLR